MTVDFECAVPLDRQNNIPDADPPRDAAGSGGKSWEMAAGRTTAAERLFSFIGAETLQSSSCCPCPPVDDLYDALAPCLMA